MTATISGKDERIVRLLAEGNSIDFVSERGVVGGWTRGDILRVASDRGWTLDASGRVPREDRPAVAPGKVVPRPPSGMAPGGFQPAPAAPGPADPRDMPAADLIARGDRHREATIRTKAKRAQVALDALRSALVAQVDEDRQHAEQEKKREAARARLAELDAERARLQKLITGKRKPGTGKGPRLAAVPSDKPINHGTWGGYLAEKYRGLPVCPECEAAKVGGGRAS